MADKQHIDDLVAMAKREQSSTYAGVDLMWYHIGREDSDLFDITGSLVEEPATVLEAAHE